MSKPTDHEPDEDDDFDPDRAIARMTHPLAWLGLLIPLSPFIALFTWLYIDDVQEFDRQTTELCTVSPACEGDVMDIAYARSRSWSKNTKQSGRRSLITYRRSPDCSYILESYYRLGGELLFQGSPADPDPEARAEFLAKREQWHVRHEIRNQVPCSRVDEL